MKRAEGHTREVDSCQQRGCKKATNVQIANALAVHLNKLIQQKYTCWRKLQDIVNKHELFTILMFTVGAGIITILNTCRHSKRFKLSISIKKNLRIFTELHQNKKWQIFDSCFIQVTYTRKDEIETRAQYKWWQQISYCSYACLHIT